MGMSKSSRIITLLVIDSLFFLLELVTGYAVHSLALVADSFHMLNDVLSLLVGLWAVKMANKQSAPKMYTYGYQRAETLGALVNGVFLVALCVTICLEAISRFVEPQVVNSPQMVLIVGCLGLLSNIIGLVLFHDHGHAHGGHNHSHGNEASQAEEGHAGHVHEYHTDEAPDHSHEETGSPLAETETSGSTAVADLAPKPASPQRTKRRHSRAASRAGLSSYEEYLGPTAFRNSIIETAGRMDEDAEDAVEIETSDQYEPLLATQQSGEYGSTNKRRKSFDHAAHKHAQPKETSKGHGHSHGDLNMKGIFLHVMGDALGNLGVIATALVIWLTDFEGRFYFDPAISLVITVIILCSAIPLCKAASRILLQAVPQGIEVDDIRDDIESLTGVESAHHLHVWQLSDSKLVASLHVRVTFNFKGEGSQRYMQLAAAIRECLHQYGIHSSTIQPEFHADSSDIEDQDDHTVGAHAPHDSPRSGSLRNGDQRCLLDCDDCGNNKSCCPPSQQKDDSHGDHAR